MINKRTFAKIILVMGDLLLLYGALVLVLLLRYWSESDWAIINEHFTPFTIIFLWWLLFFGAFGLYDLKFMKNSKRFLYRLLQAATINIVVAVLVLYFIPFFEIEPRRNLFLIALLSVALIFLWRLLFNLALSRTPVSRILFFGITKEALDLADFLIQHPQLGQKPVAFMSVNDGEQTTPLPLPHYVSRENLPHFVSNQNITHLIRDFGIDTIVILREIKENKTLVRLLFEAIPLGISVVEFSTFHEAMTGKIPLSLIGEIWFLENLVGIKKNFYEFFKRMVDLIIGVIFSLPALFLFPLIALAIKLDSEGSIFYRQKRVGRHGKKFEVMKYRTMVKDADKMSGFKAKSGNELRQEAVRPAESVTAEVLLPEGQHDPRHTRVGIFLRRSYLDEIPQVINILKGEMSFVGPRPERPEYVNELKQKIPFYEMRLLTPPGITGWAQINMENDASVEDAPEKMQYDLYYIKNRSPILDLLIILKTIFTIIRREGR